jgi:hypothetical protein
MKVSPPIPVRIEWADSQGRVTASWLAAHFNFLRETASIKLGSVRHATVRSGAPDVSISSSLSLPGSGLANGLWLEQARNLFQDAIHADVGVDDSVDFVMVCAGVHNQDLGSFVRLLDHVGQVMAVFLGHGGAKYDQVKGIAAKSFLNALAVRSGGHVMTDFGHFGGLGRECVLVGLTVKNLDSGFMS